MTIITQENDIVNYNGLSHISTYTGAVENTECFAVLAFSTNSKIEDEITDGAIQLGLYNSDDECKKVLNDLVNAILTEQKIFRMPIPDIE